MKYPEIWQKVTNPEEKVEFEFSVGSRYCTLMAIFWSLAASITLIGTAFIPLIIFYFFFYLRRANAYAFTNKRVLIHRGWLNTTVMSVDYSKITDVQVLEPFLDRILTQTGHIAINTAGSSAHEIVLEHIDSPYEVKKKLDSLRG